MTQISKNPQIIKQFEGGYEFLSNMFPVRPNGILYSEGTERYRLPTAEHIYASLKLLEPSDREYIRNAPTGLRARNRARSLIENGHATTYSNDEERIELMRIALDAKFARGTRMAHLLLLTGEAIIIEGNDWGDNFWGCSPPDNPEGKNNLGILLMKTRANLKFKHK